ncbi:MAG: MBL fold metallo-hydrolase, partial [candidate division Zixibacteria bacterium]|nr:MBL fold metallo-hydrolase [candidate division Zixibacteria bacterium]
MNQNKLKIKKSIWEDFKKNLCWGILFHLQGREEDSIKELEKIKTNLKGSGKFKSVSKNLIKFIVGPTKKLRSKQLYERSKILLDIIKDLDNILNSKKGGLRLAFECPRNNKKGKANDSTRNGYSRDPFKRIKPSLKRNVALATVIYLLRGYATFFCRPRIKRDFNAAKVALNDFFQCSQFAWRLYRLLDNCHSKKGNQHKYLEEVRKGIDYNEPPNPEDSAYFIWSILLMLEIQRGNVYRQIDYLDEASRFYRHSSKRLIRLGSDSIYTFFDKSNIVFQANWDQFITPTLVRSLFEMSKIQFDLGYFLEALINEILCLAFLVKMKIIKRNILANTDKEELIRDLINVVKFLDSKRRQQVFDTEQVGACFGGPSRSEMSLSLNNPIKPSRFKRFINKKDLEFAVDIFARIGFTLFSIQRGYLPIRVWTPKENKKIEDKQVQLKGWISPFFKAHENWSTKKRGVKESPFGQYCMSLFRTPDKKKSQKFLWPSIEKQFAHRLRENTNQKLLDKKALDETEFYEAILAATTGNILNIITIPRRNQSLLMRRGYRSRREEGDLSQKTVLEGVKAALGLKQVRKKGQSRVQNKLIVLRRWQSTNPKIPKPDEYRLRGGGYFLFWQNKGIVIDPGYDFIQNFYDEGFSLSDIDAVVVTHSHPDHDDDLSTLTTLIREWNEYHESTGQGEEKYGSKELDFFLNESTNLKFSA